MPIKISVIGFMGWTALWVLSFFLQDGLEAARVSITASKLGYCLINTCILEAARITFKSILEESLIIDCSYFILFLWFK